MLSSQFDITLTPATVYAWRYPTEELTNGVYAPRPLVLYIDVGDYDGDGNSEILYAFKDEASGIDGPLTSHRNVWWETLTSADVTEMMAIVSVLHFNSKFTVCVDIEEATVSITIDSFTYTDDEVLMDEVKEWLTATTRKLYALDEHNLTRLNWYPGVK